MSQCPNCNARLSCGCQRRVAKNGAATCTKCVASYNAQHGTPPPKRQVSPPRGATVSPTNVKARYNPPTR